MYNVKLIRGKTERLIERDEYRSTENDDRVSIQLLEKGAVQETVSVPTEYDVVYVMNLQGKTLRVFSWPPRESRNHRFDYSDRTDRTNQDMNMRPRSS